MLRRETEELQGDHGSVRLDFSLPNLKAGFWMGARAEWT